MRGKGEGLLERLVMGLAGAEAGDGFLGDLAEEAGRHRARGWGEWRVGAWRWLEVARSARGKAASSQRKRRLTNASPPAETAISKA